MSPSVSFDWVNDGNSFEIKDLPITGHRQINQLKRKKSRALAEYSEALFLNRCNVILATKRILDKHGVERAKEVWDTGLESIMPTENLRAQLIWDKEKFQENLNEWYKSQVLERLGATDIDSAVKELTERTKKIDFEMIGRETSELHLDLFIEELYWRIRNDFSSIRIKKGEEYEKLPLTKENLERVVVYPGDAIKFYARLGDRPVQSDDMEKALEVKDEKVVLGNSMPRPDSLTPSSPSLPSTSTPTTETERPSVKTTAQNG